MVSLRIKILVLRGMWILPGPLSEKLNFEFVINSKTDFSGGQKRKNLHFDTKFHTFRSNRESNNFKICFYIIMKFSEINASQIYFWLHNISGCEKFLSKFRRFIKLLKKTHVKHFFSIFDVKYLFNKPSEIQWNITGTLTEKLKRNISWALSYKILPPEITKTWETAILGVLWGPGNQFGIP